MGRPKKLHPDIVPEMVSYGIKQEGRLWKGIKFHTKGKEVTSAEETELNMKEIIIQNILENLSDKGANV